MIYTERQACRYLKVARNTLRKARRHNRINAIPACYAVLYTQHSLDEWNEKYGEQVRQNRICVKAIK